MIQATLLLGLPPGVRLEGIELASQAVVMSLSLETVDAACPLCQQLAHRVHSHYMRTLADLAISGKAGYWHLTCCGKQACPVVRIMPIS